MRDRDLAGAVLSLVGNAEVAWTFDEKGEIQWLIAPEGRPTPSRAQIEAEVDRLAQARSAEREQRQAERAAIAAAIRKATTVTELRDAMVAYLGLEVGEGGREHENP